MISLISLTACNTDQEKAAVFSFYGENELFRVSNGVVVVGGQEDVFDGGDLEIALEEKFANVVSYTATFYTLVTGDRRIILSNSMSDMSGKPAKVNGDLGRASGEGLIVTNKLRNIDELKDNLWFELKTIDANGVENTYQLQLSVTEISA